MMEIAEEFETTSLHRQLRDLRNKNEILCLQHNKDKLLNQKMQKLCYKLENYVVKLTAAYHREKSEVTVLRSSLRDVTNKHNAAVQRIYDLEHQRDGEREVELMNADITIEKQREVIKDLEKKLSIQQRRTKKDEHFCQNELEISSFKCLLTEIMFILTEERENRNNNLKSYIDLLKPQVHRQQIYGRQDVRVDVTTASPVGLYGIETSSKCTVKDKSNFNVGVNDSRVEDEHDNDFSRESKHRPTIYFEENSVYRPIGTSDSIWLTADF